MIEPEEGVLWWSVNAPKGGVYIKRRRMGAEHQNVETIWLKGFKCGYCDRDLDLKVIGAQFDDLRDLDESVAEAICPRCQEALGP